MNIIDLYKQLFGRKGIQEGSVIDMSEHGRAGGLSTGQPFKFVTIVDQEGVANPIPTGASTSAKQDEIITALDPLPTSTNNPSTVLAYDVDGNLSTITETIGINQYQTTLTYTSGVLTGISSVVKL